jgi:hypothetical protein
LFSGESIDYSDIFGAVCSYSLKTNSTSTKWEFIDNDSKLNATYGAGIVYNNFLYYIFGGAFGVNDFTSSNVLRLDLSNPTKGWEDYSIPGCDLNLSIVLIYILLVAICKGIIQIL